MKRFFLAAFFFISPLNPIFLFPLDKVLGDDRPNIFLFLSDDLTYHDIGCYGNEVVRTPHIDDLARRGLRLDAFYNSSPMCAPTRMSLYTGIHPVRNGAYPNHSEVYSWVESMPSYLKKLGYRVGLANKTHYLPKLSFPFEHLEGREHDNGKNGIDFDMDRVDQFIDSSRGQPWCFVFASNQPHTPWNRGDPSLYDPDTIPIPSYLVDTPETREAMTRYYAEISYMDGQLGRCIQYLEESDQIDNTVFFYLGEQGSNFPFCKWTCYETGLRSAGIVQWPGVVGANRSTEALIQYVDVLPTLIEIAGGDVSEGTFDGRSFLALLKEEPYIPNQFAYGLQTSRGIYHGPEGYGIRSIRNERYRLIWNLNHQNAFKNSVTRSLESYLSWGAAGDQGDRFALERFKSYRERPEYELYDLVTDRFCLNNLMEVQGYEDVSKRLKIELLDWMEEQGDEGAPTEAKALSRMPTRRDG